MKRQAQIRKTYLQKIFAKGLVSKINKEFLKFNNKNKKVYNISKRSNKDTQTKKTYK